MVDNGGSILFVIIPIVIIIIILTIFIIVYCVYQTKKRASFSQTALQYITKHFPYLVIISLSKGGAFSSPEIQAVALDSHSPIESLYIREQTIKTGKSEDTDTEVTAVIVIPESELTAPFIVKIRRQGFFNKIFLGENIVLGIKHIDDSLLINGDPQNAAAEFLLKHIDFVTLLANRHDLEECRLQKVGSRVELFQRHGHFDNQSLIGALEILCTLVPTISQKQLDIYKEAQASTPRVEPVFPASKTEKIVQEPPKIKDKKIVIPVVEESLPVGVTKTENTETETAPKIEEAFCTDEELINELKKPKHKVDKIEIKESEATMFCESEFFQQINWQWTEDKIKIRTEAKVDEKVQLEISVKHSITTPTSDFNWSDPLENLAIEVAPEGLQDEFEQSYDIIKCLQKFDKRSITGELHLKSQNGSCVLTLEVEKTQKNVETCFELLEATSWKWLNRFIMV